MEPLYQIGAELAAIYAELEANDGELTPELEEKLSAVSLAWETKVERVALMCRALKQWAKFARAESTRLRARAVAHKRGYDGLRRYLLAELDRVGRDKVPGPLAKVAATLGPPSAEFEGDVATLPPELVREKVDRSFAASVAIEWHRTGKELPEGVKIERTRYARIT